MKHRQHRLSRLIQASFATSAVAVSGTTWAQDAAAPEAPASAASGVAADLSKVTVTGFRASLQRALDVKRNSNAIVDAISAEDIGKFPDRNAAESLAHLPGVSVDRLYGEGEKVSINGTDPQLNRVLVNGQTVATADWGGAPGDTQGGRTFNYTLLAPEIIGLMEVYKSPEARIDEGSIGGTVLIHTRKPFELPANTLRGSLGYLYNDRSKSSDPKASILYSWKNDNSTFGGMIALTRDKQRLKQASVQFFCGYTTGKGIPSTATITGGGDPATARMPVCVDSGLFDQQRTRNGAQGALQWKLDERNELNLTGIYVKGKYDNFSQARYTVPTYNLAQITSANVSNGLVNSVTFTPSANGETRSFAELDTNYRTSDLYTKSLNLTHEFKADEWKLKSQIGWTKAYGGTTPEYLMKFLLKSGGYSFNYGSQSAGLTFDNPAASNWGLDATHTTANPMGEQAGGIAYDTTIDSERYGQLDLSKNLDWGPVKQLLVGAKWLRHENGETRYGNSLFPTQSVSLTEFSPQQVNSSLFKGLNVDEGISNWPTASADAIKAYLKSLPGADTFNYITGTFFNVEETTQNLYTQFDYDFDKFRGNFGVRYVDTGDRSAYYLSNSTASGVYTETNHRYRKLLPSFNLVYDVDDNKTARFSVAKVIARSRYSDLAGATSRDDQTLQGTGGNPDLKPYQSTNVDLASEWYFQPRSMLGFEFFFRHVDNYVVSVTNEQLIYNPLSQKIDTYSISSPVNASNANVRGLSLSYQQDLAYGFGLLTNYTLTGSTATSGLNMPYLSHNVYTITPYFETGPYSLRLVYNYRGDYFTQVGKENGQNYAGSYKSLDLSASYQLTKNVAINFNATNLLDTTYYQYDGTPSAPVGMYKNGRLFVATMSFKL